MRKQIHKVKTGEFTRMDGQKMKQVTTGFPIELLEEFDSICKKDFLTRKIVLTQLMKKFVDRNKE